MNSRRAFVKNMSMFGMLPFIGVDALEKLVKSVNNTSGDIAEYGNVIDAPTDPAEWKAFVEGLATWRTQMKEKLNYDGSTYDDPSFKWTQSNYSCGFIMIYDLEFYNPQLGKYTVEKFIERGRKDFGGYDSVVLWHAYPRIGIDDRNQFDFYRDMPGGLTGIREVVRKLHDQHIKVFINYNPWDIGTRRENKSDLEALAMIVSAIDADGIFLDTLKNASFDFRGKLDAVKPGIVVEGELAAELEVLPTHHLSWAQEFGDKYVPGILRNKWFERRHIQHQIARWTRDHTPELHQAWLNGSGIMIWENVFGQWLPWNKRDRSILRAMLPIQRRYSGIFNGEGFTPLVKTNIEGIFASLWEGEGLKIWTLVNRHDKKISGQLLTVPAAPGFEFYDLIAGKPALIQNDQQKLNIRGEIGPRAVACILAGKKESLGKDFPAFLAEMKKIVLYHSDDGALVLTNTSIKSVKPTKPVSRFPAGEMVEIKPATIRQTVSIESRECGTYTSQPLVAVDLTKSEVIDKTVHIPWIAIDTYPVTNQQFHQFIKETRYQPKDATLFLAHWKKGSFPEDKKDHPVVYVDLDDARAYAAWVGKRLPLESEWQYAAQGYHWSKYPWGNELRKNYCNDGDDTTSVYAFPDGKSPFGCYDMCGNTWEMTESEYADEHNRFCMLKGGSFYQAEKSHWYSRGGPLPSDVSTKFLMMYGGLDRCATIGFRCVVDLAT